MKTTSPALAIAIAVLLTSVSAYASDAPQMRQKMADAHQKMAECLRSDKPMPTCKEEMMKSCHDSMGKDGCGMMKDMHGKMMGKEMDENDSTESSSEEHKKHHP